MKFHFYFVFWYIWGNNPTTFQYKILNYFFVCNYTFVKWLDDIFQVISLSAQQSQIHYNPNVCHFSHALKREWHGLTEFSFHLRELDILLGILNPNNDINIDILNYCILDGKWFTYQTEQNNSQTFFFQLLHLKVN